MIPASSHTPSVGGRRGRAGRLGRAQHGSVSVEMAVLVFPLTVLLVLAVVLCFRVAAARLNLQAAAAAAARTASLARTPATARGAAGTSVRTNLADHHLTCRPLTVTVDLGDFQPGGQVSVTLTCTVSTRDLVGLAPAGSLTGTATATAVIDTWRTTSEGSS